MSSMSHPRLTIEVSPRSKAKKTRVFRARLLGHMAADALWDLGETRDGTLRPVWLAYFATTGAARLFTANLRAGRRARIGERGPRLQLPKSSQHRWTTQPVPGGIVTVAYLPELFHLDPPVPFTEDVRFVMAPARAWIERQGGLLEPDFGADAAEAARAALFAAYLDRRTPLPLLRDLRFHLALYRAALEEPWTRAPVEEDSAEAGRLAACGLDSPLACSVAPEPLGELLTEATGSFLRLHPPALSPPPAPPLLDIQPALPELQLGLDFGES